MQHIKTLADNEAVSNETQGYMNRRLITASTAAVICIIGDFIKYWSNNTIDTGYTKTN